MLSNHMVEWVVVPLSMYLMLFGLRDRFNILHMPLADLVALFVIANVAFALNEPETRLFFEKMQLDSPSTLTWLLLAMAGVGLCVYLVVAIEKRIGPVAIRHVSVGVLHPSEGVRFLSFADAIRDRKWLGFHAQWSMSFGLTAVYIAAQCLALGVSPIGAAGWSAPMNPILEAMITGIGTFAAMFVLAAMLLFVKVFRYSKDPLPLTT